MAVPGWRRVGRRPRRRPTRRDPVSQNGPVSQSGPVSQNGPARVVVGAAIVRDGRLLAQRRARPAELAGRWELPGGRVERGESEAAALRRECREELGALITVLDRIGGDV